MTEFIASVDCEVEVEGVTLRSVGTVRYEEELNSPFKLTIECVLDLGSKADGAELNRSLRHKEVSVRMERQGHEDSGCELKGLIANSYYEEQLGRFHNEDQDRMGFTLEVVPAFALLAFHRDKPQVWHNRTYTYVLEQVLKEELGVYGRTIKSEATAGLLIPLITRSPGESALAFVQRLLYESGINSRFDHSGASETLVLSNQNDGFPKAKLPYDIRISLTRSQGAEYVDSVRRTVASGPSVTEFAGFDPVQSPGLNIGELGLLDSLLPAQAKDFRWTAVRHSDHGDPDATYRASAGFFADRAATALNAFEFDTSILGGIAGQLIPFELEGEPIDAVVLSVRFELDASGGFLAKTTVAPTRTSDGGEVTIRAPMERPPKEYVGLTLARIASSGAAVDVDDRLWCKIRFVWDTEGKDEPQVRAAVMQPMAGAYGGTQWIPRKGDVVIVAFLEGNRENPVIIGCQYTAKQNPLHLGPVDSPNHMKSEPGDESGKQLPKSASWLGWSYSSIAGERPSVNARTMMAMNVAEGTEFFYTKAPRDYRVDVERNADTWIKGDATRRVEKNLVDEVAGDYRQEVKGRSEMNVAGAFKQQVGELKVNSEGAVSVAAGAGVTTAAGGKILFDAPSFFVNSPSIGFSTKPTIGGGAGAASGEALLNLRADTRLSAPSSVILSCGGSSLEADPNAAALEGRRIKLESESGAVAHLEDGKVVIEAPDGIVLRCGDTEISLNRTGVRVEASKLEVAVRGESSVSADRVRVQGETVSIESEQTRIAAKRLDITD